MDFIFCAYIGPGAGLQALGALWAVGATLLAALGVLLMAPFRALMKRFKKKSEEQTSEVDDVKEE